MANYRYDQYDDIYHDGESMNLLNKISVNSSSFITVKNIPGFFISNNGDETFLFVSQQKDIKSISNILSAAPASDSAYAGYSPDEFYLSVGQYTDSTTPLEQLNFQFYRLSTNVINILKQKPVLAILAFPGNDDSVPHRYSDRPRPDHRLQ